MTHDIYIGKTRANKHKQTDYSRAKICTLGGINKIWIGLYRTGLDHGPDHRSDHRSDHRKKVYRLKSKKCQRDEQIRKRFQSSQLHTTDHELL